jgi:hypothetical protein
MATRAVNHLLFFGRGQHFGISQSFRFQPTDFWPLLVQICTNNLSAYICPQGRILTPKSGSRCWPRGEPDHETKELFGPSKPNYYLNHEHILNLPQHNKTSWTATNLTIRTSSTRVKTYQDAAFICIPALDYRIVSFNAGFRQDSGDTILNPAWGQDFRQYLGQPPIQNSTVSS